MIIGVPFQYTLSHVLRARLEYLQTHYQIRESDFLNFDALRQTSQVSAVFIRLCRKLPNSTRSHIFAIHFPVIYLSTLNDSVLVESFEVRQIMG